MEPTRNLSQILNQNIMRPGQQDHQTQSFNTFLTIYGINLAHRFPDVTDLTSIDYGAVRSISEFSVVCSQVALETWLNLSQQPDQQRVARQRVA